MRTCAVLVLVVGCYLDTSGLRERDLAVLGVVDAVEAGQDASAEGQRDAAPEARGDGPGEAGGDEGGRDAGATDAPEGGDVGRPPSDAAQDAQRDGGVCGAPRALCCPGGACAEDTVCVQGSCMPCGTLGSMCCVTRCETATACAAGFCVSCGLQGRICCDGMRCFGGATCRVDGLCR